MVKRSIEYSPHFVERPLKFGEPLPKRKSGPSRKRKPLSEEHNPSIWENVDTMNNSVPPEQDSKRKTREWETYVLDKGAGTQETIQGRAYTIGKDHAPIDIWTSPPDTWGAQRIAAIRNCRIITLKREKPKRADDSSEPQIGGWVQAVVIEGTSAKPNMLIPRTFSDGIGSRMYISVEWSQIISRRR